jgi:hypothetical protein
MQAEVASKLEEGKTYTFSVIRKIKTPDTKESWVIEDPYQYRHLLPAEFYHDYPIMQGRDLYCKVDKINCDGQIFLEPQHPYYNPGSTYDFTVIEIFSNHTNLPKNEILVMVRDHFGQQAHVMLYYAGTDKIQTGSTIKCRVERVKKGKLYLSDPSLKMEEMDIEVGRSYIFKVIKQFTSSNGEAFFLLLDPFQHKHLLTVKYYGGYGIKTGREIRCKVVKFSSKGYFLLEPEHPYYQQGHIYDFKVQEIKNDQFILLDRFKEEIKVKCPESKPEIKKGSTIKCCVTGFKKGKVLLELNQQSNN